MEQGPVPLQYQPTVRKPMPWRRMVRIGVWVTLLTAAVWAGRRYGPIAWRHGALLYWQGQCMAFNLPPGTVVYEEDPDEAAKLIGGGYSAHRFYQSMRSWNPSQASSHQVALRPTPECFWKLRRLVPFRTTPGLTVPGGIAETVVFLHEMQCAGRRRLVCVTFMPRGSLAEPAFADQYRPRVVVIDPATWTATATEVSRHSVVAESRWQRPAQLRVYAGQIDPNDPSRFTIPYDAFGQRLVLQGRLTDQDVVVFTPRDAATTQRDE